MSTLRVTAPLWRFLNNPYPRPENNWLHNHIPGQEVNNTNNIKREDKEHFHPRESKTSNNLLVITDFIKDATEELKKIFYEKWIKDLFGKDRGEKYVKYFDVLEKAGFKDEMIKAFLNHATQNAERVKNWSYDNEKVGKVASTFMSFAIPLGIVRNIIPGLEVIPNLIQRIISFAYALTSSIRGYYQYSDRVYNRPDDEAAMNRYQAEVYGNKVAGSFGTAACFMETKVNPFALPVAGLFEDKKVLDNTLALFTIPNLSWWRARMPAHINQEYLTDLTRYLLHKPLSLFGIKSSKKVIQEIKERGNLKGDYVTRRYYENIGLKSKEDQKSLKFILELFKNIKNSFNKDIKVQLESSKKAGETIAPIFGFTAFISTIIGTPLRVVFRLFDRQNRITDFFNSLSLSCQQLIYLFKMVIPILCATKNAKINLLSEASGENKEKLTLLYKKFRNLSWLGISTFTSSIINTTLKLFRFESPHFEKAKSTIEGLAGDLVSKFFSERRHVLGFQFRAENPEFYEEVDEVIEEEQPQTQDELHPQPTTERKQDNNTKVIFKHLKPVGENT